MCQTTIYNLYVSPQIVTKLQQTWYINHNKKLLQNETSQTFLLALKQGILQRGEYKKIQKNMKKIPKIPCKYNKLTKSNKGNKNEQKITKKYQQEPKKDNKHKKSTKKCF